MIFGVSFLVAVLGTWLMRGYARSVGFVNQPNAIVPQHTSAVAYGGGVGVAAGTLLAGLALGAPAPLLLAAVGIAALGLYDDAVALSAGRKFLGQVLPAALVAWEVSPTFTGIALLDAALATFWGLVLINAVNLTDVCDGLVGGLGALALAGLGFATGEPLLLAAGASCLGFLVWNRPPASIYLGDAGSMLIGLLAAWGSLKLLDGPGLGAPLAGFVIPGVFLFELVLLVAVRVHKGLPWWKGSPDHFSLRMQAGPFSRWQTVLTAWTAGALLAGAGWSVATGGGAPAIAATALATVLLAGGAARALLRWEVPPKAS